jgi:undecaprenyl-diphosphatase
VMIGFAQGIAVIPGISRSGITIATGLALGFERKSAARFSFLLSMPITLGACLLKLRHLTMADFTLPFVVGVLAAGISGYIAIGALLKFVQNQSFLVFAVYRLLLAAFVWMIILSRGG